MRVDNGYGNITSTTTNGTLRNTPTSVSTNRLTSGVYDAGGNLTSWNGAAYGYDRLNMPTQICSSGTLASCPPSAENWIYAYTADDERILEYRIGGGAFRTSLRDLSGKILREYRLEANVNWLSFEDFIYRDSTLLASVHPTEGTRWFGPDHLGTPRAVFNSAGSVIGLHTYYPFGEEATAATQDTQQMKFTGHERDQLNTPTGVADDTDYMHARQFSILTGRFHSFDPIGGNPRRPQSWNRYAYVLGNPLKYTDPFGLDAASCDGSMGPCQPADGGFGETITITGQAPQVPVDSYIPWFGMWFYGDPRVTSVQGRNDGMRGNDGGGGGWGALETRLKIVSVAIVREIATCTGRIPATEQQRAGCTQGLEVVSLVMGGGPSKGALTVLQYGGRTLTGATLEGLGLSKDVARSAIEALKDNALLRNPDHGIIWSNGDGFTRAGRYIGNIFDYTP